MAEPAVQVSQVNYASVHITLFDRPMCPESQSGIAATSYISKCCDRYADEFLKYLNTLVTVGFGRKKNGKH